MGKEPEGAEEDCCMMCGDDEHDSVCEECGEDSLCEGCAEEHCVDEEDE